MDNAKPSWASNIDRMIDPHLFVSREKLRELKEEASDRETFDDRPLNFYRVGTPIHVDEHLPFLDKSGQWVDMYAVDYHVIRPFARYLDLQPIDPPDHPRSIHGAVLRKDDLIQYVRKWKGRTAILDRKIRRVLVTTDGEFWSSNPSQNSVGKIGKQEFIILPPEAKKPRWQVTSRPWRTKNPGRNGRGCVTTYFADEARPSSSRSGVP